MKKLLTASLAILLAAPVFSQHNAQPKDTLLANFQTPPNSAKPRVWWHWMNGNITKDGIAKDLFWMHKSGIGGFQTFDAALATPQIVQHRLTYMTPEWKDAFRFTAHLADSLHLEMAIAGSPGWSETGGPWVKPEDGMKKLVWTETRVAAGDTKIKIPQPPSETGPFQNIPKQAGLESGEGNQKEVNVYKDVAVIAYRLPASDKSMKELNAQVTSSGGNFELNQLTDGDLAKTNLLPSDSVKGSAWIQFAFAQSQTIKAVTVVGGGDKGPFGLFAPPADARILEASEDGKEFHQVALIPAGDVLQQTIAIPITTAKYFRVRFKNPAARPNLGGMMGFGGAPPKAPPGTEIAEIVLHPASRINRFEEKDAFSPTPGLFSIETIPTEDVVNLSDVLNLTDKLSADGILNWTAPAGNWIIIRFGYSLMGILNHPASPEATGPEVDKLDPLAIKKYFTNYLDQYKDATGGLMGKKGGLQFMVTDSWEAGAQNWTANLMQEFQKRRGYSMLSWMPVFTGHIVKNAEASEQFLFDFRKTLADLVTEYHYDGLTKILEQYGMKRYSESHESGRALIADGMEVKRTAAIPMSAMWTPNPFMNGNDQTGYVADIRESGSVAHIYGQNIAAAESLTALGVGGAAWSYSPENLKPTADLELASGLNRFVIHTSVHQPVDDKIPGLGLGPFGQWFNRHETWAGQAKAWTDYLSRSSYLLQQGKFIADIVYYYGEDNNITALFGKKLPAIPEGYNYDFVNADALINLLSVKNGKIVTPSGMSYRVLVLDSNARKMSLPVLRKISEFIKEGAMVTGIKPESLTGLSGDPQEFNKLVEQTWSSANPNVFTGKSLDGVLDQLKISKDVDYSKPDAKTKLLFVHRKTKSADIYWINNRNNISQTLEVSFRIAGFVPELWHAETGKTEQVSYQIANGVTKLNLHLDPADAVFVLFRKKAVTDSYTVSATEEKELATITGEWDLTFQKNRGAPASSKFAELKSWSENNEPGIKYFSGTGTYSKTIDAPAEWFTKTGQLYLDLGEVKNLAEVIVNGKSLGVLWRTPFRVEISKAFKPGKNTVVIKVTNLWVNRLIGDQQPGITNKITYTTMPFYQAGSPLLKSGMMGPVKMIRVGTLKN